MPQLVSSVYQIPNIIVPTNLEHYRPYKSRTGRRQLPTNKMGVITVANNSAKDIQVKLSRDGDDSGQDDWFFVPAEGGRESWNRNKNQVISFVRSLEPGTPVETILGVVGATTTIGEASTKPIE
ncbi:hypothetical protein MMC31_003963 [Peltigera leucophlebia]|nr:hypothetical protein [Peltigera leucophlebia]